MRYQVSIKKRDNGDWTTFRTVNSRKRCREILKVMRADSVFVQAIDTKTNVVIYTTESKQQVN